MPDFDVQLGARQNPNPERNRRVRVRYQHPAPALTQPATDLAALLLAEAASAVAEAKYPRYSRKFGPRKPTVPDERYARAAVLATLRTLAQRAQEQHTDLCDDVAGQLHALAGQIETTP